MDTQSPISKIAFNPGNPFTPFGLGNLNSPVVILYSTFAPPMRPVFLKEISSFFSSIVGYITLVVFLGACGIMFWVLPDARFSILDYGYVSLDRFFDWAPWMLLLLIPAVTMRSFADELSRGTIEWLFTKPLSSLDIILGKYLAALALILIALLPTLIYVYTISDLALVPGSVDSGSIIGSYIGLFFLAASFASIGIFCSSLASNQIVGFLLSLLACVLLYSGFQSLSVIPAFTGGFDYYLSMAGMQFHYTSISRGLIDSRDVVYFLSIIALFIAMTRISLASRRWDTAQEPEKETITE